jgi:hypothetical protein
MFAVGIPIGKKKGLYVKSCIIRNEFKRLAAEHHVDVIVIEEALQSFKSRSSSAGVIATLNRFNGIVSYLARSEFDCPVVLGNVISVRKAIGLNIEKKSVIGTKDQVLNWVRTCPEMKDFDWPTKLMKSGPDKNCMRIESHCYDIADAYVVAKWGAIYLKNAELDSTII